MKKLFIPLLIIIGVLFSSLYIVEEGTRAIVLRFNKVVAIAEPGLHFKIPGIDSTRILDAKIQTTDSSRNQARDQKFITREKKDLIVDYYVQWRIVDFNRYYEAIAGGYSVENILLARLSGRLRAEIGKLDIKDIINDTIKEKRSRNSLMIDVKNALNGVSASSNNESSKLPLDNASEDAKTSMRAFGVEVVDVRIKQINFPTEVSDSIYARMSAEREVVAREQRFLGIREAEETRAKANLRATEIISEAERTARAVRGEGDAEAARLYAEAFKQDKAFFSFIRSLKAYQKSFNSNDVMVISPDSEFLRYMQLGKTKVK